MDAQLFLITWLTLLPHMGLLMCHPTTWRVNYPSIFQPGPQFCPDTGRTVCAAVDYYPTDRIYNLLTSTRSQVFNLTSLFVDERKGDTEPNTSQLIIHPPYYQNRDSYGPNQPPPSGRFSPAGRTEQNRPGRNPQNRPNGNSYWTPSNRWRQVQTTTRAPSSAGYSHAGEPGHASLEQYNHRGQNAQRQRTDSWRQIEDHNNNNEHRYNQQQHQANRGAAYGDVQHAQRTPDDQYNYGPDSGWQGQGPSTNGYNQPSSRPDQYHQTHGPNVAQNNNKGQPLYRNMRQRELTDFDYSWNQPTRDQLPYSQDYIENADIRTTEPKFHNSVKRGKRNQDVEVACPVQSTFVPPRAALNDQSQWKYIVNVPERDQRFSQVVRVDVCMTEGQACSSRLSLPFGFESRCRQKYIKKKLLSLNTDGQGTGEDNFFIPSCCVCEIVRIGNK